MTRVRGVAHFRIEETITISTGRFSAVKRHVRHLQEVIGISPMFRRQRNADTRADIDLVTVYVEWLGNEFDDAIRKRARGLALVGLTALNDGKFVAAEARQHVGFPQEGL